MSRSRHAVVPVAAPESSAAAAPAPHRLAPHVQVEVEAVQRIIDARLPADGEVTVLEAGCGSLTRVRFGERATIVGIDISAEQLARHPGLDVRIEGDIQEYPLPDAAYDAIVCWYVFEHLPRPDQALAHFATAVKPGGLVIIAVPNVLSPKVLLTKFSPHWFHVWVYRHVFGSTTAGRPGHPPFPTTLPLSLIPDRLQALAESHGLRVVDVRRWEDPKQRSLRERFRITGGLWRVVRATLARLTGGRLDGELTECLFVLDRPD